MRAACTEAANGASRPDGECVFDQARTSPRARGMRSQTRQWAAAAPRASTAASRHREPRQTAAYCESNPRAAPPRTRLRNPRVARRATTPAAPTIESHRGPQRHVRARDVSGPPQGAALAEVLLLRRAQQAIGRTRQMSRLARANSRAGCRVPGAREHLGHRSCRSDAIERRTASRVALVMISHRIFPHMCGRSTTTVVCGDGPRPPTEVMPRQRSG